MDFTELIQVQFTDKTLDAVCLKDPVHTSALRTSVWKRSALMTTVSPLFFQCTEVSVTSSTIIQSFLGKDSLRTVLFSSLLAVSGFGPCGGAGCLGSPDLGSRVGHPALPNLP